MTPHADCPKQGIGVTELVGLRTRLKPGMEDAYESAHATIWPELQVAQREAGIRRWLIFRHGLDLLHVVECDDFDRAQAELASNPVDGRWQVEMARYVVQTPDGHVGAADRLSLIYNGDNSTVRVCTAGSPAAPPRRAAHGPPAAHN
jgi:L-rhamnose mutarotase